MRQLVELDSSRYAYHIVVRCLVAIFYQTKYDHGSHIIQDWPSTPVYDFVEQINFIKKIPMALIWKFECIDVEVVGASSGG
jgi:hypothetical protein